jgi:hypothetical protein
MKTRQVDERYRPIVTVKKMEKNKPTVIQVSGETYVLAHKDQRPKGRKN